MLNQRAKEDAYLIALLDSALLCLAFVIALMARIFIPILYKGSPAAIDISTHLWTVALGVPLFWILASHEGVYTSYAGRSYLRVLWSVALPFLYLSALMGLAIFLLQAKLFSRAVFFMFLGLGFCLIAAEKMILKSLAARPRRRAEDYRVLLIVGAGEEAVEVRRKLEASDEYGVCVVGHVLGPGELERRGSPVKILGSVDQLDRIAEEWIVDEVVFALPFAQLMACERQISWCEEVGRTVHLKVDFVRTLFAKTYPSDLEGTPMLTLSSTPRDAISLALKRVIDMVGAGCAIVAFSPIFLVCALLVRLTSPGPIFFRQKRVGLNGRVFTLLKFRSMHRDAETRRTEMEPLNETSGPVFKMRNDPRITWVGRFLRKFSLDELPQLINVLRGDLSLVGPRPPLPDEVQRYERWQRRRLSVKPGITCIWQVSGRSAIGFEDWMKMDLDYIDNWSLKQDLKILLRTVPAVVFARGAQ